MKKIVLLLVVSLFCASTLTAQKKDKVIYKQNWDKQKLFWGYYLGINNKDYKIDYTQENVFIDVTASTGFDVGLIGDLKLTKHINLRLEPGLSSNTKELAFTHIPGGKKDSIREVNATYLRVPLLVKLSTDRYYNIRPYVIGGVSYDYNFSSNQDNPDDNSNGEFRMKKNNFTYELGVGIDIYMPYFIFSPSIRGVFAINNELVKDNDPNSQWTGNVDNFGTRGIFLKLAFH
ncbi:probable protein-translocating porin PorT [Lutibacter oricola]|uniref:Probable protein-translocating porin PorT n=1 Tax=Lutibacter oricola TaxID=762486 RepID=A0A1H3BGT4_9FLAO|nr:porin family protein [Lutibacter oricola]SDX40928.1 probable protein-translocating porin PorT [Lutibacter oricola]